MNIKSCLLAASLVVAAATNANAAGNLVQNGTFDGSLGEWDFTSPVSYGASLIADTGVIDTILPGGNSIVQTLSLAAGHYELSFTGLFLGANSSLSVSIAGVTEQFTGAAISGVHTIAFDVSSADDFDLTFGGKAANGFLAFVAVDNVSVTSVTSVPGPEAGAGLAGLAMAGIGAYMIRRRRQDKAATA